MDSRSLTVVEGIRAARAVRATLSDGQAEVVLDVFGVDVDVGLIRKAGQVSTSFALALTVGGGLAGGLLATRLGWHPLFAVGAGLLAAALAARSVNYNVRLRLLPGGEVDLSGTRG